ncbi:MAG: hypothetical protein AUH78_07865 [Gemmatimonadetes bacterium 13_1_40CM_4_69_8]|nr:MAG: hypothetical protein AUH78_07865 [Gemmatimonadetes bacterium 13_1_40CM_4_69_8]OLE65518.1 MAG: hypothetical protein AUG03_04375 [Acidobacteria bacterium 13_1_20CM_2_68_14]PYP71727.1 MAG: hypothetical protein DMD41_11580 [Gemmatimonadota bacterium]
MNTKILLVPWAGPAIAAALLCGALAGGGTPKRAAATPAAPVAAMTAARIQIICAKEALAYLNAWKRYIDAWNNYELALPGGTYDEIMDAALLLDQAATEVGTAGFQLIACLAGYLGGGGPA